MVDRTNLKAFRQKKLLDIIMTSDDPNLIEMCSDLLKGSRTNGDTTPSLRGWEPGHSLPVAMASPVSLDDLLEPKEHTIPEGPAPAAASDDLLITTIRQVIADITEIPVAELRDDVDISFAYGIDSLIQVDIISSLEKKFNRSLGGDLIRTCKTVGRIAERIQSSSK